MNATPSILIFQFEFFAPTNMALVHLFCFTTFFKFTCSKQIFFCEKDFIRITAINSFFVIQKILLRTPCIQKVKDPTFLRPEFDVRFRFRFPGNTSSSCVFGYQPIGSAVIFARRWKRAYPSRRDGAIHLL